MCTTGRNERGKPLSAFKREALAERNCALFLLAALVNMHPQQPMAGAAAPGGRGDVTRNAPAVVLPDCRAGPCGPRAPSARGCAGLHGLRSLGSKVSRRASPKR